MWMKYFQCFSTIKFDVLLTQSCWFLLCRLLGMPKQYITTIQVVLENLYKSITKKMEWYMELLWKNIYLKNLGLYLKQSRKGRKFYFFVLSVFCSSFACCWLYLSVYSVIRFVWQTPVSYI